MSSCSVRVLEERSILRCLRVDSNILQSNHWRRVDDYNYTFEGPRTIRDALRCFETLIGQFLHACDSQKSPLYEINTEHDVGRGREASRFTSKRSKYAFFAQIIYYSDKNSILTEAESAALERANWVFVDDHYGERNYKKEISYRDIYLQRWQVRQMGINDWEKILKSRSSGDLAPGFEEYERCPTCSVANAHRFE